jgi:hypothetical protein
MNKKQNLGVEGMSSNLKTMGEKENQYSLTLRG